MHFYIIGIKKHIKSHDTEKKNKINFKLLRNHFMDNHGTKHIINMDKEHFTEYIMLN